jgi:hypothetical protein
MAYGLRYTIPQKLRDDKSLVVKIYEDGYSGSSYQYIATSIIIQPNSADEDALACIISTELNINFIVNTEDDYTNFPDLLNYNDTKYYVELTIDNAIKWRGYLFNDYVNLTFTTGIQEISLTCIDGLSFLRYKIYSPAENSNGLTKLLDLINNTLYFLPSYTNTSMYMCCSYFATGMNNRTDGPSNDPFSQSYQYRRDFIGLDYYTILQNIMLSFGCRLFQSEGDWYILPMNQMPSTIYYTKYIITSTTPSLDISGTLNKSVSIEPYSTTNVHFINNSQTKIVRKGYPTIQSIVDFTPANNYIHNGNFKSVVSSQAVGWDVATTGSSSVVLTQFPSVQFNRYSIFYLSSGTASITTNSSYLANMYGGSATFSFDFQAANNGQQILVIITITIAGTLYYLTSDLYWRTSYAVVPKTYTENNVYQTQSIEIPLGLLLTPNPNLTFQGPITIKLQADSTHVGGYVRNVILKQNGYEIKNATITRNIGNPNQISKSINLYYGLIYPLIGQYEVYNNIGFITNSSGVFWSNWYVQGTPATTFYSLPFLIMRQYSNLLNKNVATLEGDIGNYNSSVGIIGLDKVYSVSDSSTNSLTYNGKKFIANRLTINPYLNETNSMQLIEVSSTNIASTESIVYITDQEQETPKRYF